MLRYRVRGAGRENFEVTISGEGDYITVKCTCPAGGNFKACAHRIALLSGHIDILFDQFSDDPGLIKHLIAGTELERAVENVLIAERGLKDAQKLAREAKEYLGFAMTVQKDGLPPGEVGALFRVKNG